jgi:hypothetical protein
MVVSEHKRCFRTARRCPQPVPSKLFRLDQRVNQVHQHEHNDDATQQVIESHGEDSDAVAKNDVARHRPEQGDP